MSERKEAGALRAKIDDLLLRRFFYCPAFEIYGCTYRCALCAPFQFFALTGVCVVCPARW